MLVCMRTTINLPESLAEAAKAKAAASGRTFTSLVEEGLRIVLSQSDDLAEVEPLPTYGNPDQKPLIDLEDKEALWDALDADGWK